MLLLLLLHDSIWLQLFKERLSTEAWSSNYDCWRLCRSNYSAHDAKYYIKEQIKCAQVKRGVSKSMSLNFSARLHVLIKKYYQKIKRTYNIKKKKFNLKKQTNNNHYYYYCLKRRKKGNGWRYLHHSWVILMPLIYLYQLLIFISHVILKKKKVLD